MPTSVSEAQIKSRIEEFVQELDLLVRKSTLDALRSILENGQAPARRGRRPGRPAGARAAAAGAAAEGLAPRIADHLRSNPGQTVGEIVKALGTSAPTAKKTIKAMLAARQIRKTGQRRGTRYFPGGQGRLPGAAGTRKKTRKKRGRRAA